MENHHKQLLAKSNYLADDQNSSLNLKENIVFTLLFGILFTSVIIGLVTLFSWGISWIANLT